MKVKVNLNLNPFTTVHKEAKTPQTPRQDSQIVNNGLGKKGVEITAVCTSLFCSKRDIILDMFNLILPLCADEYVL